MSERQRRGRGASGRPALKRGSGRSAALGRRVLWRTFLVGTGGLRIDGQLPERPSVLIANHASHADTAALLAAIPARRRPVVAAAADYWFADPGKAMICRLLAGGFPVRRRGGGTGDLDGALALLAAGHDVIIYAEGSRSRDGSIRDFRSGALRLAQAAGAPLVPVGIAGTRHLLPVHGRLRPSRVTVRFGEPVADLRTARTTVAELAMPPGQHRIGRRR